MRATEILRNEHEIILRVVEALKRIADAARQRGVIDRVSAAEALEFLSAFADRCHHAKEEQALFPTLVRRGLPGRAGPIAVMLAEHDAGRALRQRLERDLSDAQNSVPGAVERFASDARELVDLLCEHIDKENGILFPMADEMLSESDEREILDLYERHERDEMAPGTHERFLALADVLCARFAIEGSPTVVSSAHGCCGHGSGCRG